ncbi:MAG: nucleoside-diphosphate sugar epimerase/dehydratase [Bacteroidales bacterium]|nr:nucleoside-diphosphate sugar epimerase/dehydratase [Bacteroidales bacterium]
MDCAIVALGGYIGAYLDLGGMGFTSAFWQITHGIVLCLMLFFVGFRICHTYSVWVRYSSFIDLWKILSANVIGVVLVGIASVILRQTDCKVLYMPNLLGIFVLFLFPTFLMWLVRIAVKGLYEFIRRDKSAIRIFIYGTGLGGTAIAKSLRSAESIRYHLVGFFNADADTKAKSRFLIGVPICNDESKLIASMKQVRAQALFVSPIQVDNFCSRQSLIDSLIQAGINIYIMPNPEKWDGKGLINAQQFKEVEVGDLLPRDPITIDMNAIEQQLRGKCVLVTGAAGSIGAEITRQVAAFSPSKLILIDQAETPMHDLRLWVKNNDYDEKVQTIVASITNEPFMEKLFATYRPDYVFHAAAYKHVPMMEDNPAIAIQNNVRGTRIVADLAVKYGVGKFVMVSTDKAVNPTNVMGCSKRICEIYCQSLNKAIVDGKVAGKTQFVTTRFGNVLGSNGSVIPLFQEQIRRGGPVTVTDQKVVRYFMLIPEACKLVLEAGTIGRGGEIFVFDMGNPVRIADLATRMIALSGAKDIKIVYTGLRDGEKLYEEVLSNKENTKPTPNAKILVAATREFPYEQACAFEDRLLSLSLSADARTLVHAMQELVPEYETTNAKYI